MARIANVERKAAPEVEVVEGGHDERRNIIDRQVKLDPSKFYGFHRFNVTDNELQRDGWEKVGDGQGGIVHHNGDPLVARDAKVHRSMRDKRHNESYEMIREKLVGADKAGKLQQVAQVKQPKQAKTTYD